MSNNDFLSKTPVSKVLFVLGGLGVVSMISEGIYGVLDKYFVSILGIEEVQAVSIVYGISFFVIAVAMWLSMGGMIFVSIAYGNKDLQKIKRGQISILTMSILGGIFLNFILFYFSDFILSIFTLNPNSKISAEVILLAKTYLEALSFASVPIIVMLSLNFILRSVGYSIIPTLATIITACVNALFDYYVIYYTQLGIMGIAWATVLGFSVSMFFLFFVFFIEWKKNTAENKKAIYKYFSLASSKSILGFGLSSLGKQISTVIALTSFNLLASLISVELVASWGVATDIFTLALFITYGLNMGMMPLLGYSYGAGNFKRSMQTINTTFIVSFIIFSTYSIFIYIFAENIMNIYFNDKATIEEGVSVLRILTISFPVVGIIIHGSNALQLFDKKFASMLVGISRQLLFFVPLIYIFFYINKEFDCNINIVWGQVISDIIAVSIMAKYYFSIIKPKLTIS